MLCSFVDLGDHDMRFTFATAPIFDSWFVDPKCGEKENVQSLRDELVLTTPVIVTRCKVLKQTPAPWSIAVGGYKKVTHTVVVTRQQHSFRFLKQLRAVAAFVPGHSYRTMGPEASS